MSVDVEERTIGQQVVDAHDEPFLTDFRTLIDTTTAEPLTTSGTPFAPPIIQPRRRHVRDLMRPPVPSEYLVQYVQETVTTEAGGADVTEEGAAKNETSFAWAAGELRTGKVTAWVPVTSEIYEDAPGLAAYINSRMGEQVGSAEDDQLINGDGTYPNLKGFLDWSGILTQTAVNNDPLGSLGRGIAQVENKGTVVDGIICNIDDYWDARLERRSTIFDDAVPFDAEGNVFGIPTVRTATIAAGTALVGSFQAGATLRQKSPFTVRMSNSHDDFFVKNKLAVVAEEELALTVHRVDYFCSVAIDTSA